MVSAPSASILAPAISEVRAADGNATAELTGAWDIRALETSAKILQSKLRGVARSGIRFGVHGNCFDSESTRGLDNPTGNFTAIGD